MVQLILRGSTKFTWFNKINVVQQSKRGSTKKAWFTKSMWLN